MKLRYFAAMNARQFALLIVLLLHCITATAQDEKDSTFFAMIKRKTTDSLSVCYYPKVYYKATQNPEALTWTDVACLYYGKEDVNDMTVQGQQETFYNLINKRKYKKALQPGWEILNKDPADLRVLMYMVVVYEKLENKDSIAYYGQRLSMLREAILETGDGSSKEKAIKLWNVIDEYSFMSMLDEKFIRRTSTRAEGGMHDIWKTDKGIVYFYIKY